MLSVRVGLYSRKTFHLIASLFFVPLFTGAVLSKTDDQEKYDPQFAITY